jgi:hypothetical protein
VPFSKCKPLLHPCSCTGTQQISPNSSHQEQEGVSAKPNGPKRLTERLDVLRAEAEVEWEKFLLRQKQRQAKTTNEVSSIEFNTENCDEQPPEEAATVQRESKGKKKRSDKRRHR